MTDEVPQPVAAPDKLAGLDDLLQEFAAAQAVGPAPVYPDAAQRLTEIARLRHQNDEWRQGVEAQMNQLWEAAEAVDEIRAEEEQKARIADVRQRHGLNGHTPDALIAKLVDDPDALKFLADQDRKLADAEASHAHRRDIESAMLSVRGQTFDRQNVPDISTHQMMAMSDREWSEYKASLGGER